MCLFVNLHYKHKQAEVSDCITTKDKQEIKLARLCAKVWRSCSQQLKPTNGTLCLISIDQSFNLYISHKLLCKKIHWKGYQMVRRPFLHSSFAFWLFLKSFVITIGCEDGLGSWNNATCTTVKLICLLNTALKQSVWCAHSLKYLLELNTREAGVTENQRARGACCSHMVRAWAPILCVKPSLQWRKNSVISLFRLSCNYKPESFC